MRDRHSPTEHRIAGCGTALFAAFYSALVIPVALLMMFARPGDDFTGSRASLALHDLALFSPFWFGLVFFWWAAIAQYRRARPWAAGLARERRTPTGWIAVVPNPTGPIVFGVVLVIALMATAGAPLVLMGKRNPLWFWSIAGPVDLTLAYLAYRRFHYEPTIIVDETERTVTFPRGRRVPPLTIPWSDVVGFAIETREESANESTVDVFDCAITVRHNGGTETIRLAGRDVRWPTEKLIEWLAARIAISPSPT
ncbi:MAG: hypothetical protein KF873_13510 [Gemmataceae bacterium]|nr:hypothetical protein [Planctomycetia bacterium]MBX3399754.1 hypothetical protein [Gemmataceae bacterium]